MFFLTAYQRDDFELILGATDSQLCLCSWPQGQRHQFVLTKLRQYLGEEGENGNSPILEEAKRWLDAYFKGENPQFPSERLLLTVTPFQLDVLGALLKIPYGELRSYAQVARMAGHPEAVRAVASAVASNPLTIFVPCHRVIRSDGHFGNYAGTPEVKKRLINLETRIFY